MTTVCLVPDPTCPEVWDKLIQTDKRILIVTVSIHISSKIIGWQESNFDLQRYVCFVIL